VSLQDACVAFDLGAGSGRAFVGVVDDQGVRLDEAHRFRYAPRHIDGHLRWDMARLFEGLDDGLRRAQALAHAHGRTLATAGVDTWGVDYGIVDADGRLLEEPCSYRDTRTDGVMDEVFRRLPREAIFAATGLQFLPLNTLYQLVAHVRDGLPRGAARLLMMPDLCHHWLCGSMSGEETNASTTQLLDARTRRWSSLVVEALGLPAALLPDLVPAGTDLGALRPERQRALAAGSVGGGAVDVSARSAGALRVIAPATHDTASAVAGIPLEPGWAYISSGTWSLVGVERQTPLIDDRVAAANFTNEAGAFGSVRLLTNVMGLWILESCRHEWQAEGRESDLARLLDGAAALAETPAFVDPDAPRFFHPSHMTRELQASLRETGQPAVDDPVTLTRIVLDSLACRYADVVDWIEQITGDPVRGIHIVGGGSRNAYLNQATSNASERPVLAGPVEATAAGNVLVQAIAVGLAPDLAEGRRRLAASTSLHRFEPRDTAAWRGARERYRSAAARR
jgi:rhamnulokinase